MGQSSTNGTFSMAMLKNQRVSNDWNDRGILNTAQCFWTCLIVFCLACYLQRTGRSCHETKLEDLKITCFDSVRRFQRRLGHVETTDSQGPTCRLQKKWPTACISQFSFYPPFFVQNEVHPPPEIPSRNLSHDYGKSP